MQAKQIGIVICRAAAVILLVQAVRSFGFVMPLFFDEHADFEVSHLFSVLATLSPGLIAVFLWVFAERIATIPGQVDSESPAAPMTQADLIGVGTLVIGLYVVVMALFSTIQSELSAYLMRDLAERYADADSAGALDRRIAELRAVRITNFVELLLGAFLIVGRTSIARVLTKARYAGTGAP